MRLSPDCMRDILLASEALPLNVSLPMNELAAQLSIYSKDELTYTCIKLHEGNLLNIFKVQYSGGAFVSEIRDPTYEGHQFLENIRDPSLWGKVKQKLSLLGTSSVPAITSIASQVVTEHIKSLF